MVCAITFLAYPKDHVFALKLIYVLHVIMISSFQNLLYCSLISCEHVISVTASCNL